MEWSAPENVPFVSVYEYYVLYAMNNLKSIKNTDNRPKRRAYTQHAIRLFQALMDNNNSDLTPHKVDSYIEDIEYFKKFYGLSYVQAEGEMFHQLSERGAQELIEDCLDELMTAVKYTDKNFRGVWSW